MKKLTFTLEDYWVLSGREVKHLLRRMDTLITAAILPVFILLLFVYLFGGAMQEVMGGGKFVNYVLPGILLTTAGVVSSTTAATVNSDLCTGFASRVRSMPVSRSAFIVGHYMGAMVRNLVAGACVVLVALAIGYHSNASWSHILLATIIYLIYCLTLTALAIFFGILASGPDAASAFTMPLMFLAYFTGALIPLDTMPRWLQAFCRNQPINKVWEVMSSLTTGVGSYHLGITLAWCVSIFVISLILSALIFAKKV